MSEFVDKKKTDSLEVRLSKGEKDTFLAAVARRNTTASSVIRAEVSRYSSGNLRVHWAWLMAAITLGMVSAAIATAGFGRDIAAQSPGQLVSAEHSISTIEMLIVPAADVHATTGFGRILQHHTTLNEEIVFGQVSPATQMALLGGEYLADRSLSVSMRVDETNEPDTLRYQFTFNIIDADGNVLETRWSTAINATIGGVSRVMQNFDDQGLLSIIIMPLKAAGEA